MKKLIEKIFGYIMLPVKMATEKAHAKVVVVVVIVTEEAHKSVKSKMQVTLFLCDKYQSAEVTHRNW